MKIILAAAAMAAATGVANAQPEKPNLRPLALEVGVWDADITFPSGKEGVPPTKAKGVQVNTLHSNGMWMLNAFHVEGTPYEGTGFWGWDASSQSYKGVWGDNNEHRIRQDTGVWDEANQTMNWTSTLVQAGKAFPLRFKEVFKGDTRTFDMVVINGKGEEQSLVSMVFTKRKT